MTLRLSLFPLGLVLLPGLVLPLHVFEERYRALVRDLLALPEDERRFGVIAIRRGREVGVDGVTALHEVGVVAQVSQVAPHEDGRYDLATIGTQRFRLLSLEHDQPYATGVVELLPDELGSPDEAESLDPAVRAAFKDYLAALGAAAGQEIEMPELPDRSLVLSYLVASSVVMDLEVRQGLLAQPDGVARLRAELVLLRREVLLLDALSAAPSPDLARTSVSLN